MFDPSPTSELEALNAMLATIGESPVHSTTDSGSVDAEMALQILTRTSRRVQEKGWAWNTSTDLVLLPDTSGECLLPSDTLKVASSGRSTGHPIAQRGLRLYNRKTNAFTFDGPLTVTLVEFLPFDQLPEAARQYVTLSASRVFQDKAVGSGELAQAAGRDEQLAWIDLFAAEAEVANYNVLTSGLPAQVLAR